ncbi:MAG: rhodanese-like domain-containing protein, partial [Candidatus Binatia bacterium]
LRPEELDARIARGENVVVLDVRTEDAVRVHPEQILGARWMPLATVVQQAETLPRQGTIVTYCT